MIKGVTPGTPTSFVTVKVFGFASVGKATSFSFKVPVQYTSTVNAIPRVMVMWLRYDKKVKTTVSSQSFTLGSAKAGVAGNALVEFSGPVLENPRLQVETTLTYKFKTVYSISPLEANGIFFQIPSGFTFDMSKVLVNLDGNYLTHAQHYGTFIFIHFKSLSIYPTNIFSSGVTHTLIFERVDLPVSSPAGPVTHYIKTALNG